MEIREWDQLDVSERKGREELRKRGKEKMADSKTERKQSQQDNSRVLRSTIAHNYINT